MEQMNKLHERFDHFTATLLLAGMSNRDEGSSLSCCVLSRPKGALRAICISPYLQRPSGGRTRTRGTERGEGDPEEVNLLAQDGVGGAGVDLSCVLKVWFVFFLALGATPKK